MNMQNIKLAGLPVEPPLSFPQALNLGETCHRLIT